MKEFFLGYNKNLILLFLAQIISCSGNSIFLIALPWIILDLTDSTRITSLVTVSAFLPPLLFGIIFGGIVDKYSRKKIIVISDFFRFVIIFIISILLLLNIATPLLLGIFTFILYIIGIPSIPARDSLIPNIAPNTINAAYSIITISTQISHLIGPLLAALLVLYFNINYLFFFISLTFIYSMILTNLISVKETDNQNKKKIDRKFMMGGIYYIKSNHKLFIILLLTIINNIIIMGPAMIGITVYVKEILNDNFVTIALIESALGLGMIFGSILTWYLSNYFSIYKILFIGIIFDGITFCPFYWINSSTFTTIMMFIHGIGIPIITISRTIIIQKIVPNKMQGRIFTIFQMAITGATSISIIMIGFILNIIKINLLFLIIGLLGTSCIFFFLFIKN